MVSANTRINAPITPKPVIRPSTPRVSRRARLGARFLAGFGSVLPDDDCLEAMQGGKVRGRYLGHYSWLPLRDTIVTRTHQLIL